MKQKGTVVHRASVYENQCCLSIMSKLMWPVHSLMPQELEHESCEQFLCSFYYDFVTFL